MNCSYFAEFTEIYHKAQPTGQNPVVILIFLFYITGDMLIANYDNSDNLSGNSYGKETKHENLRH